MARQPIFDRRLEVYGYEILFRQSALDNFFDHPDPDEAATRVIQHSLEVFGLDVLGQDRRIFFNVTRSVLLHDFVRVLPRERTVIELLESVTVDDEVVRACRALKREGFTLALDDFVAYPGCEPLLELADIVKVDFLAVSERERRELPARRGRPGLLFLAEKVETAEAFEEARALGYDLFQGFFFRHPEILAARGLPTNEPLHLALLRAANRGRIDAAEVEAIAKQDVALALRLLRFLNAAAGAAGVLHEAIARLDESTLRRFVTMAAITGLGANRPRELVLDALIRARLCEELAPDADVAPFLAGTLSAIGPLLGRPLPDLLGEIGVHDAMRAALLSHEGRLGAVLELAEAYGSGEWEHAIREARRLSIDEALLPSLYRDAVAWAERAARL